MNPCVFVSSAGTLRSLGPPSAAACAAVRLEMMTIEVWQSQSPFIFTTAVHLRCMCRTGVLTHRVYPPETSGAGKDVKGAGTTMASPRWLTALMRNWGDAKAAVSGELFFAGWAPCLTCADGGHSSRVNVRLAARRVSRVQTQSLTTSRTCLVRNSLTPQRDTGREPHPPSYCMLQRSGARARVDPCRTPA